MAIASLAALSAISSSFSLSFFKFFILARLKSKSTMPKAKALHYRSCLFYIVGFFKYFLKNYIIIV
jgi:hypothetical protein